MIDFITFIASQFFNLFAWLDTITIVGSLSLLKILIIIALFMIGLKLLTIGGKKNG